MKYEIEKCRDCPFWVTDYTNGAYCTESKVYGRNHDGESIPDNCELKRGEIIVKLKE